MFIRGATAGVRQRLFWPEGRRPRGRKWGLDSGFEKTKPTMEKSFFFVCLTGSASQGGRVRIQGKVRRVKTQFSFSFSEGVPSGRLRSRLVEADRQCGLETVNFLGGLHAHKIGAEHMSLTVTQG